ncbi:hypothetical protein BY996DRAFT_6415355 [Phakopsora pachyrhizi]|nr:hypothetical protein BY996DRAFT_6415355 [Phakopsora pachyrhizi]
MDFSMFYTLLSTTFFFLPNFISSHEFDTGVYYNSTVRCQSEWNTNYKLKYKNSSSCVDNDYMIFECPLKNCYIKEFDSLWELPPKEYRWNNLKFKKCRRFLGKWGDESRLSEKIEKINVLRFWDHHKYGFINAVSKDEKKKSEVGYHCPWQGESDMNNVRTFLSCTVPLRFVPLRFVPFTFHYALPYPLF